MTHPTVKIKRERGICTHNIQTYSNICKDEPYKLIISYIKFFSPLSLRFKEKKVENVTSSVCTNINILFDPLS